MRVRWEGGCQLVVNPKHIKVQHEGMENREPALRIVSASGAEWCTARPLVSKPPTRALVHTHTHTRTRVHTHIHNTSHPFVNLHIKQKGTHTLFLSSCHFLFAITCNSQYVKESKKKTKKHCHLFLSKYCVLCIISQQLENCGQAQCAPISRWRNYCLTWS